MTERDVPKPVGGSPRPEVRSLQEAFAAHPRRWREFRYVYPVISRRSRGLSIGVNLSPDAACNFKCVYCCADRECERPTGAVELAVLEAELRHMVATRERLFDEPEFKHIPTEFRRLNDIAFSGDGEATGVACFPGAVEVAIAVRRDFGLDAAKIILITNAAFLARPAVAGALGRLYENNGEIWAKLDAGTEEYFQRVNCAKVGLQTVLGNILAVARRHPLVVQSLFCRIHGEPPTVTEIAAYVERLRWLKGQGAQIAHVQVYSVARSTAEPYVGSLSGEELERIADAVRAAGIAVLVYA